MGIQNWEVRECTINGARQLESCLAFADQDGEEGGRRATLLGFIRILLARRPRMDVSGEDMDMSMR